MGQKLECVLCLSFLQQEADMNTDCQLTSFSAHQFLRALACMCMPLYILTVWTELFNYGYSQGTESSLQSTAARDAITTIRAALCPRSCL